MSSMHLLRLCLGAACIVVGGLSPTFAATSVDTIKSITFAAIEREYELYIPASATNDSAPLLVLLHGSGGSGRYMINLWRADADRDGMVLVAPNSLHPDGWRLREDSPEFIKAIVDAVTGSAHIDTSRIYLFGQSGGAVYAMTLAMLESEYFAAVAIHAGAWRHDTELHLVTLATRKVPIKIIVGDRDEFFSLASVRASTDALRTAGFPVEAEIVAGQHHWYEQKTAPQINASAWTFLKGVTLNGQPRFTSYVH